ncbi:hypothetical protein FACS1894200_01670 [Spirochaetia bacterium]|nr:hypothetical protein FACS1894200_01670 [Spirochaetia bacterium]
MPEVTEAVPKLKTEETNHRCIGLFWNKLTISLIKFQGGNGYIFAIQKYTCERLPNAYTYRVQW